jgi:hypothetical protein
MNSVQPLKAWADLRIPKTPNYNISSPDKTQHIRQNPPLTAQAECWENQHFADRWRTLLSVDDIVTDLFALLHELDIEKKTFVVYVVVTLSLIDDLARGAIGECDVISVATEFMVESWFGSRCDGGARVLR